MALTVQELDALKFQLTTLLEFDEPMAILTTLRRVAERKAHHVTRGLISRDEAERWTILANALSRVEAEIERRTLQHASAP
jgi:hypothetical protein